ncbi:hypothetical protein MTR67_052805, partial [Solanum verrucosum]
GGGSHVLQYDAVEFNNRLTYIEEPVAILERIVRQLRSRVIHVVKFHWRHRTVEEATWEIDRDVREQFLGLFEPSRSS